MQSSSARTDLAYTIRLARNEDGDAMRDIEVSAAQRFAGLNLIEDAHLANHMCPQRLSDLVRKKQVWVACADELPVGFVVASHLESGCLLEELDVLADHGGRGLGRRLVAAVLNWAKEHHYTTVILSTFRDVPWNAPFYARLGFEIIPEDEFTPDLRQLRKNELAAALPLDQRVFMRIKV
ncbi:MAG: GNAT family N-acetyltransferase [Candidatus Obscuribacterales bacterium]|nr:GNAT family N-acetyltransferase [Candidatus Obscuribacterales bacterium]